MIFHSTKINGVHIIEPELQKDERGYFGRIFCQDTLMNAGIEFSVRQVSQALSVKKGTVRGLHFQKGPAAEQKIVQCMRGAMYDVVVDLREGSSTYGQWIAEMLTEENKKKIYIPKGCAHGFQTLADNSEILYLMSAFYAPEYYMGARWDDPVLHIAWPAAETRIISEQDRNWPLLLPL